MLIAKKKKINYLYLFFILIIPLVGILYFDMIFSLPLFGDAATHGAITKNILNKGLLNTKLFYPPLYHILQATLFSLFGEKGMNSIVFLGVFLIAFSVFLLFKELTDKTSIALLSVIIVLASPKVIFYSARLYMEILLSGLFVFTIFFLVRFVKTKSAKNLILLAIFTAITASIKQQGLFILFPSILLFLCCFFIIDKRRRDTEKIQNKVLAKHIVIYFLIFLLSISPAYFVLFHNYGRITEALLEDFKIINLINRIGRKISGYKEPVENIDFNEKWSQRLREIKKEYFGRGVTMAKKRHIWPLDPLTSWNGFIKANGLYFEKRFSTGTNKVHLSYHWYDTAGKLIIWNGKRTSLLSDMAQGATATINAEVIAPPKAGTYFLKYDLVHENVTWFSQKNVPMLEREVKVVTTQLNTAKSNLTYDSVATTQLSTAKYNATYNDAGKTPTTMETNRTHTISITITNTGTMTWPSSSLTTTKGLANLMNFLMLSGLILFVLNIIFKNKILKFKDRDLQIYFLIFLLIFLAINYILFLRSTDPMRYHLFIPIVFSVFSALSIYFLISLFILRNNLSIYIKIISIFLILALLTSLIIFTYKDAASQKSWYKSQLYRKSIGGIASVQEAGKWLNNHTNENDLIWQTCGSELLYYSERRVTGDFCFYFLTEYELKQIFRDLNIKYIVIFDSQIVPDEEWESLCLVPESFTEKIRKIYPELYKTSFNDIRIYKV